jgi:glycerate 2-kinase
LGIMRSMGRTKQGQLAEEIFHAALKAVDPYTLVKLSQELILSTYEKGNFTRFCGIAFGKGACPMAKAMEEYPGIVIDEGIVVTKYDHCEKKPGKFRLYEAGHPVPDMNGLKATAEISQVLRECGEKTLVVSLISGGGSALLVSPCEGISLGEKQEITRLLLKSGADISELNAVRKHISAVKGGRLAALAHPAKVVSLILSDVVGDSLDVIASGPTAPDESTYKDALDVLEKYSLTQKAPQSVLDVLRKGRSGLLAETPKADDPVFGHVENIIVGSNGKALDAAKEKARALGLNTEITSAEVTGEAKDVAAMLAKKVKDVKKRKSPGPSLCLLSGGETTVTVSGNGLGGRNMEFALAYALEIDGLDGVTLLSAGTDGTDGPTDAAGAVVDGSTVAKARRMGLDPEQYLNNNDSYNFFRETGDLLITGPTGTNVMDVQITLIE